MSHLAYAIPTEREINVASVPHRSPFRYPGGKTWLVPYARLWLQRQTKRPREIIEPFAGGAIIALTAVFEDLAQRAILVELDPDVCAVWQTVFGSDGTKLARRILEFVPTRSSVLALLSSEPRSTTDRAFQTIVRNRVQRGGILAPGAGLMKEGENGKGLRSRWYPQTLCRRINELAWLSERVRVVQGDGVEYIERNAGKRLTCFFVDPPYTVAGRRLYRYSDVDHGRVFRNLEGATGDFLMTYDDSSEIRSLSVRFRFDCETVAMKNTHNSSMIELLIGRSLDWLRVRAQNSKLRTNSFLEFR